MPTQAEELAGDVFGNYWQECAKLRPSLIQVAAKRCKSAADPEDIVQEALVRGADYRDLDLERLPQFLVAIVIRLCADEVRRAMMAGRMARHPGLLPVAAEDPAEFVCDRAEARWLVLRLASLAPRDRKLVLMLTDGVPRKEIARVLHTTPQGAYSALYRIRCRIAGRYV